MSKTEINQSAEVNGIHLHYLDYPSDGPAILLLHSLSGNAHIFGGLITNGLIKTNRLIIPDLRGRGESQRVLSEYSLEEESKDLAELLDHLGLQKAIVCGHSFGGLLAVYFATHYPERVEKLIIIDAAVELNPLTPFLISYATGRLLFNYPSWDAYVAVVKNAPFMDIWDEAILPFLRADVIAEENGTLRPKNSWVDVGFAASHIFSISSNQWRKYFNTLKQPVLLLTASAPYVHGQHIVTEDRAIQSAALITDCIWQKVDGNHLTMLFGNGARQIVNAISQFTKAKSSKFDPRRVAVSHQHQ